LHFTESLHYDRISSGEELNIALRIDADQDVLGDYAQFKVKVTSQEIVKPIIIEFEIRINETEDVDVIIPVNSKKKHPAFALIIGNEDYSTRQTSIGNEVDVPFATNDARIVKDYVIKTLGFYEENVYLLIDATAAEISQKISLISSLATKSGPESEILFYYAGHGLPEENSKEPLLIPVDVSYLNLDYAIKLQNIYKKFEQTGSSKITIILDACFSGGGRDQGLLGERGVRIKPSEISIPGKMVAISASKGSQSALPYQKKQHGLFTYYFLKKLQQTRGEISYGEMFDYLDKKVSIESLRINSKEQDPEIKVSALIENEWRDWHFK
jgi:uncharacterized caspase-like protein